MVSTTVPTKNVDKGVVAAIAERGVFCKKDRVMPAPSVTNPLMTEDSVMPVPLVTNPMMTALALMTVLATIEILKFLMKFKN